ncbi:MAG: 4-hydroxy-tetrahydrodipicolinate reductase, partial [Microcoleaceae cyanobacterium]
MTNTPIPVVINGAGGKMGREVVKAVADAPDMSLFAAIDHNPQIQEKDVGELAGCGYLEVPIMNDLQGMLALATQEKQIPVMVDFTHPDGVYENARAAIA